MHEISYNPKTYHKNYSGSDPHYKGLRPDGGSVPETRFFYTEPLFVPNFEPMDICLGDYILNKEISIDA